MTRKIGLAGKSGSGKDLIADYIGEHYGFKKIAVADAIRDEVDGYLRERLFMAPAVHNTKKHSYDDAPNYNLVLEAFSKAVWAKPTSPEMRVLLQWWGTEYRRSIDPDYWIKRLAEKLDNDDLIVVSDIRTPDEMKLIQSVGGEVWFVERPDIDSVGIAGHYTEVALEGATFDIAILNDSTIEDLKTKIDYFLR